MPAPEIIHQLVKTFDQNRAAYRSGKYNEAQLRQQFLDKFFTALGWDVGNTHGYPPENAEVVIEDSLEVEGTSKAPDYCFRLGHDRKFFVEAKKPAIDIKYDIHPAYQLRRYAWNAHLPLSILTDFEELSIYNTKAKPNPTDSPATCRDKYYHYTEYIEKWDEIAAIFSREAVWNGSFDKFAAESKGKKGTTEVDDDILATISEWRKSLAINIALRNKPLIHDEAQLNYAVQMTIDRILFLRICEDRGIEPEDQLKSLAAAPAIYPRLVELFRRADTKYNSGLFHFSAEKHETSPADTFTPSLIIDDKVLKEIIKDIYYPCPYIFKEIPVEILGQVYEQFLGKVIRLTPAGLAKVEEKPEVRKAGGVYYTPTYIVDYIVENTVGELLKGKTPEQASALKIVDPACGSGSFLLGAFEYLMDWHYQWYTTHDPESWAKKKNPPIYPLGGGWRLTTSEKKRILTNNLHGVDIDAQAVEVTKLSLLLKVLEEETGQLTLGFERVLPDLGRNIQCGNSLIGWDYFEGQLTIDEEEKKRVNPFDWQRAFPRVFAQGGFDAVIGNPPYGASFDENGKGYIKRKYQSYKYKFDNYIYFVETAIRISKSTGYISFITPELWLKLESGSALRQYISQNAGFDLLQVCGENVFEDAIVNTIVFRLHKSVSTDTLKIETKKQSWEMNSKSWMLAKDYVVDYRVNPEIDLIISKIKQNSTNTLAVLGEIIQGITPYDKYRGQKEELIKTRGYHYAYKKDDTCGKWLSGKDVSRYRVNWSGEWLSYGPWLAAPRDPRFFNGKRILFREVPGLKKKIQAVIVSDTYYHGHSVTPFVKFDSNQYELEFILGIVNSILMSWFGSHTLPNFGKEVFPKMNPQDVAAIPVCLLDFSKPLERKKHDQLVNLVNRMLDLHKRTPATPQEHEQLTREIAATDHQIDQLVYQLYGLTDDEIKIVEGSN